ncbi:MAG TPA: MFS transporter [Terriglobia bacterium]|nr:MFS transporter [Terriglobia bacterium]
MTPLRQSRTRWLLIFWIFILGAIAFLDRVNISIAGASIAAEYHLSNVQLGYVFSAFLVGYALFQTPGGRLADRVGPRRVMAVAVIWWGVFTVLTASLPTRVRVALWLLIAVRFSLGAGEAVMYPASNQFVAKWIPTQERGIANGLIFAGVGTGSAIAPPLITYIMVHYGWRTSFWISAALGIVAGAVWFLIARDAPRQHPWVSASELTHIQSGLTVDPALLTAGAAPVVPWPAILRSKDVRAVTLSYFSYGYMSWIFFSWFFIYLSTVRGMSLKDSAGFTMLPFLAMAIGSPLGGLISDALTRHFDKWRGRCVFSCVVMALAAAFLILGAYLPGARWASVALAAGAGALYMSQSCYWSVTADIAGPSSGAVSGLMNMGAQLGGAVTASLTPAIAGRYGWTASFLVAAALCAAGAVAWLTVDPTRTISPQRHRDTETIFP